MTSRCDGHHGGAGKRAILVHFVRRGLASWSVVSEQGGLSTFLLAMQIFLVIK